LHILLWSVVLPVPTLPGLAVSVWRAGGGGREGFFKTKNYFAYAPMRRTVGWGVTTSPPGKTVCAKVRFILFAASGCCGWWWSFLFFWFLFCFVSCRAGEGRKKKQKNPPPPTKLCFVTHPPFSQLKNLSRAEKVAAVFFPSLLCGPPWRFARHRPRNDRSRAMLRSTFERNKFPTFKNISLTSACCTFSHDHS
jgi:hypothetical protein